MPALIVILFRFLRALREGLKSSEFRGLFYAVLILLGLGTWFYSRVEGWDPFDAFYFSVITLTTVGYGDFSPQTRPGRLFTIFFLLLGLGVISGFVVLLAEHLGLSGAGSGSSRDSDAEQQEG